MTYTLVKSERIKKTQNALFNVVVVRLPLAAIEIEFEDKQKDVESFLGCCRNANFSGHSDEKNLENVEELNGVAFSMIKPTFVCARKKLSSI